jgi:hypothetical protein
MKVRITKLKKFIKDNKNQLYIKDSYHFDGMVDGTVDGDRTFIKAQEANRYMENNQGIAGVWLVGSSRDYITEFENDNFKGYEVYNACGCYTVAVRRA